MGIHHLSSPLLFSPLLFFVVGIWLPSKKRANGADIVEPVPVLWGTVEDPAAGGTFLPSDNGYYAGFYPLMDISGYCMLCAGEQQATF